MRIGIIGCGKIGLRHIDAYKRIGRTDIVLADESSGRAEVVAEQWGGRSVAPDQLLAQDLSALDVCVPSQYHTEWILRGLDAGIHVFCEKPLCLSHQEAVEIQEAAVKSGVNVVVGYLYRHHPAFRYVKQTLEQQVIGEPHLALARLGGRGSHQGWKHDRGRGGGAIFEMMVHMLDLLAWLLGPLSSGRLLLEDLVLPRRRIGDEEYEANATDLAVVSLLAGTTKTLCESDLATPSFMNQLEIHGSNGSITASILEHMPAMVYCNEPRGLFDRGHNFRSFPPTNLFVEELKAFLDIVESNQPYSSSLIDSVELARFIDSFTGSAAVERAERSA